MVEAAAAIAAASPVLAGVCETLGHDWEGSQKLEREETLEREMKLLPKNTPDSRDTAVSLPSLAAYWGQTEGRQRHSIVLRKKEHQYAPVARE